MLHSLAEPLLCRYPQKGWVKKKTLKNKTSAWRGSTPLPRTFSHFRIESNLDFINLRPLPTSPKLDIKTKCAPCTPVASKLLNASLNHVSKDVVNKAETNQNRIVGISSSPSKCLERLAGIITVKDWRSIDTSLVKGRTGSEVRNV